MARPAASSEAELIRRPEDNRSSERFSEFVVSARCRWAFSDGTLVLIVRAMAPPCFSVPSVRVRGAFCCEEHASGASPRRQVASLRFTAPIVAGQRKLERHPRAPRLFLSDLLD